MQSAVKLASLRFSGLTRDSVVTPGLSLRHVVTVNADYIVEYHENSELPVILDRSVNTFDGQVPYLLARVLNPGRAFEKVSGSDLVYDIASYAHHNRVGVFLLGGSLDANQRAVAELTARYPNGRFDGYSPPIHDLPFPDAISGRIVELITAAAPTFLLVGFGMPKQDFWIADHRNVLEALGVKVVVGVGGTFEFVSGKIARAPRWIQFVGLEGLFRLMQEPKLFRLFRLVKSMRMFLYVFR